MTGHEHTGTHPKKQAEAAIFEVAAGRKRWTKRIRQQDEEEEGANAIRSF